MEKLLLPILREHGIVFNAYRYVPTPKYYPPMSLRYLTITAPSQQDSSQAPSLQDRLKELGLREMGISVNT